jgi:dihydrolipoamide dehydrogenase
MEKDILVIGGGPGGYVAAIRAAQLGASVCLIEKDRLGGTCLNRGCIPTKVLYRNAEILNTLKSIDEFGINIDGYNINVEKIQSRKQSVIDQLVGGVEQLLKANKVEIVFGTASFKDKIQFQLFCRMKLLGRLHQTISLSPQVQNQQHHQYPVQI